MAAAVAGLGGCCTTVDSYYMVPVVDGDDERLMDYYVTLQAHIE